MADQFDDLLCRMVDVARRLDLTPSQVVHLVHEEWERQDFEHSVTVEFDVPDPTTLPKLKPPTEK